MRSADLLQDIARIRAETATEYAEKRHIAPRAFVLSAGTPPVRVDADFSLPVDQSKAEFVRTIKQTVKRLNAQAVLSVSESWLTKLTLVASAADSDFKPRQQPTVVEVVLATLSQRDGPDMIWIAALERVDDAAPVLKEWIESRPQHAAGGLFFHFSAEKAN